MAKGVLYERQSRTADGSESLSTQRAANLKAAEQYGLEIVAEIIEPPSTSAYRDRGRSRPRFPELLDMIRSGQATVVVAYKTDRLSRGGGPGWAPLFDAAEAAGLDLDRFVLTPAGWMNEFELGIRAVMDREESKKAAGRSADNSRRRAEAGRPAGGGHRPYGYDRSGMEVIEAEAGIIRECVARYLAGDGFRPIARALNDAGVPTVSGKAWREGTVRNMLTHPRITGLRTHRGAVIGDAGWPAIIDRETWEALQARVRASAMVAGPSPWKYLLTRLAVCGKCGAKLGGFPSWGASRYGCRRGVGKEACGGVTIKAQPVDDRVVEFALERLRSSVLNKHMNARQGGPGDGDLTRIVQLERRLEELAAALGRGELPMKEWSIARQVVDAELQVLRSRVARRSDQAVIDGFVGEGPDLHALWDDLSLGRRRALLAALIDRIVIHPAKQRGSTKVDLERVEVQWRV